MVRLKLLCNTQCQREKRLVTPCFVNDASILKITAFVFHFFPSSRTTNESNKARVCKQLLKIVVIKTRLTVREGKVARLCTARSLSMKYPGAGSWSQLCLRSGDTSIWRAHTSPTSAVGHWSPSSSQSDTQSCSPKICGECSSPTGIHFSNFDASRSFLFLNLGFPCHKGLHTDPPTFLKSEILCIFSLSQDLGLCFIQPF